MKNLFSILLILLMILGVMTLAPILIWVFSDFGWYFGIKTILILMIFFIILGIILEGLRKLWMGFKKDFNEFISDD